MGQIASILGQITTSAISVGLIDNCFKLVQRVLGINSGFLMKTIYMVGISFSLDLGRSISVPGCSS